MEPKRRLPVLETPGGGGEDTPPRPPWQWVGFGVLAIFVVWLPLSWLATLAAVRLGGLDAAPVARALLFASGLALAALVGGYLLGRWGTPGVGTREAAVAGAVAGLVATALAWSASGSFVSEGARTHIGQWAAGALVTAAIAAAPAALGGRLGLRRRAC